MYRRVDSSLADQSEAPVIAIAQRSLASGLVIVVDPNWRLSVFAQDVPEIDEILKDLAVRARIVPDALWKQISSLNWGLLVTGDCGKDLLGQHQVLRLLNRFELLR